MKVSLKIQNSAISTSLPFLFDFFQLKEKDHIGRKMNVYMRNHFYYFDLAKIRVSRGHTTVVLNFKLSFKLLKDLYFTKCFLRTSRLWNSLPAECFSLKLI